MNEALWQSLQPLVSSWHPLPLLAGSRIGTDHTSLEGGGRGTDWYNCSLIQSPFIGVTARLFLERLRNRKLPRPCWFIVVFLHTAPIDLTVSKRALMFLSAAFQGEGLRPASRLLRGLALRPPSGRDGGAGRRLEDCERRGGGVGVRVGAEDESEAVGDAQQVGFPRFPLSATQRARMSAKWF